MYACPLKYFQTKKSLYEINMFTLLSCIFLSGKENFIYGMCASAFPFSKSFDYLMKKMIMKIKKTEVRYHKISEELWRYVTSKQNFYAFFCTVMSQGANVTIFLSDHICMIVAIGGKFVFRWSHFTWSIPNSQIETH